MKTKISDLSVGDYIFTAISNTIVAYEIGESGSQGDGKPTCYIVAYDGGKEIVLENIKPLSKWHDDWMGRRYFASFDRAVDFGTYITKRMTSYKWRAEFRKRSESRNINREIYKRL